ncbi:MAG: ribosomal protein S18-alanine N-acetyltransferase [Chloroflexi bacterium]|nr:ribosomal protein S18-alanine N-acetyltransferase [Chloroflexota bacterium]
MTYVVRPMEMGDIPQVVAIEKEAFPDQWSPSPFKRELQHNRLSRYLVAEIREAFPKNQTNNPNKIAVDDRNRTWWYRLLSLCQRQQTPERETLVVGFVGIWLLLGEAHITTIAVHSSYRRQGIGELLLIAALELAVSRNETIATLEVRASNETAQGLYRKYGFGTVGIRPAYYPDREDALVMTAEGITTASYQARFQHLKKVYFQRWGAEQRHLSSPFSPSL